MTRIFLGSQTREAISYVENINQALLHLEIFPYKAQDAIPHLASMLEEMEEDGLEERDKYRYSVIKGLFEHLCQLHNLTLTPSGVRKD